MAQVVPLPRRDRSRHERLPYGLHTIEEDDIAAVLAALSGDLLAQGPWVEEFERAVAAETGSPYAIACTSGSSALHLAYLGAGLGPGDLCIVPAVTFLATATAALATGADVQLCDVDSETGLIDLADVARILRDRDNVRVVSPVHLGGRLSDLEGLSALLIDRPVRIVEDACHALGAQDAVGRKAGSTQQAFAATVSFHPVKTITTGEGGVVTVSDPETAERLKRLRNHGVTRDPALMNEPFSFDEGGQPNPWTYEQVELGYNYRMNELEAALGCSQLRKLHRFVGRRAELATLYTEQLQARIPGVEPTLPPAGEASGWHLFSVRINFAKHGLSRAEVMKRLAGRGVGTQVHYIPLHFQPALKKRLRYGPLRGAEAYYERTLSLPLFPSMDDEDVERVVAALEAVLSGR